jgi:hypothetical protein
MRALSSVMLKHNLRVNGRELLQGMLGRGGLNQHTESGVRSQADLVPRQTDDARVAGPKHLDLRAAAQAELLEPMDVIGMAKNIDDLSRLPGQKAMKRNDVGRSVHGALCVGSDR